MSNLFASACIVALWAVLIVAALVAGVPQPAIGSAYQATSVRMGCPHLRGSAHTRCRHAVEDWESANE